MKNKPPSELIIKQIQLGPMANFQYLIGDAKKKEVAVIDPAWDVPVICQEIRKLGAQITAVFLTHGHYDHVTGLNELLKEYNVPAYMSEQEYPMYQQKHKNMKWINAGDQLTIGDITFQVIATPGHSPGCICFHYKNILIVGDTLFIDGCGRCDLPGSDPQAQYHSLYDMLGKLPDDTIIFPGHDYGPKPFDTLKNQRKTNPYLTCKNKGEFLSQRMGILSF